MKEAVGRWVGQRERGGGRSTAVDDTRGDAPWMPRPATRWQALWEQTGAHTPTVMEAVADDDAGAGEGSKPKRRPPTEAERADDRRRCGVATDVRIAAHNIERADRL